ncbi:MAG: hypothetical protein JW806_04360 [Sedimentisphaerales bacterium]|nr:hypothetical protein [Sedimentisphaerales bacterium]
MEIRKTIILAVVISACLLGQAVAKEEIAFGLTSDFYSKYVWRGQMLNDDYVYQPGISASYKGFSISLWGNVDLTDYGSNNGEFTEYDLTFDYTFQINEKVSFSVGGINYHFPSVVGDTTEIYWGFAFDVPLSPSITVYHDIDNIDGTYVSAAVSHTLVKAFSLTDSIGVDVELGASVGWGSSSYNKGYWGFDESGLNDLVFTVALPMDLGGGWSVSPSFSYITLIDGKIRDSDAFSTDSDYFVTGISISKEF